MSVRLLDIVKFYLDKMTSDEIDIFIAEIEEYRNEIKDAA